MLLLLVPASVMVGTGRAITVSPCVGSKCLLRLRCYSWLLQVLAEQGLQAPFEGGWQR